MGRFIVTMLLGLFVFSSCGSNVSSNSSGNDLKCAICGKSLTRDTAHQADCVDGVSRTVCANCYVIGKEFGKCL